MFDCEKMRNRLDEGGVRRKGGGRKGGVVVGFWGGVEVVGVGGRGRWGRV